jgi:hypothetical protein
LVVGDVTSVRETVKKRRNESKEGNRRINGAKYACMRVLQAVEAVQTVLPETTAGLRPRMS